MIFKCFPFSWEDNCLWRLPSIPFLCFSFFHSLNSLSLTHTLSLSPLLLCLASSSPGFHLFLSSTLPRLPTLSFCPSVALPPSLHPTPSFFPPSLSFSSFIYAILLPRFLCLHFSTSFSSSLPQLFPLQSLSPSFSFSLSFTSPNWSHPFKFNFDPEHRLLFRGNFWKFPVIHTVEREGAGVSLHLRRRIPLFVIMHSVPTSYFITHCIKCPSIVCT